MLKQGSNQAVRFLVYEDVKGSLCRLDYFPPVINSLLAGGFAGFASVMGTDRVIL